MKTVLLAALFFVVLASGCKYNNEEELYNCDATASTVRYSTTVTNILNSYGCLSCHNGVAASGGIRLETHAGVKTVADNGRLFGAINHSRGYEPMPQGGSKMSGCDIRKIKVWIDAGAPNN